ncbi:hypothetical protein GGS20DRAFT_528516 [Poronia punctata]|nr:hypothetical protein GGS20DRAFT_528516 [Poronia punctata]
MSWCSWVLSCYVSLRSPLRLASAGKDASEGEHTPRIYNSLGVGVHDVMGVIEDCRCPTSFICFRHHVVGLSGIGIV